MTYQNRLTTRGVLSCLWAFLPLLVLLSIALCPNAFAQVGVSLTPIGKPDEAGTISETGTMKNDLPKLVVSGKNISRADNMLVLYNHDFGNSTNTNPYGVEVVAIPVDIARSEAGKNLPVLDHNARYYRVEKVTSIWECQKSTSKLNDCGNSPIPQNGIVLSATGDKRQPLLNFFQPGNFFALNETFFQTSTYNVNVINPNQENNALGCSFPGCRGGQQLVIYNRDYGKPSTLTNEYGFEVTVRNGVVVDQEGSDSLIPLEGDPTTNFIVSGHGAARNWLTTNAPIGAKMALGPDDKLITASTDYDTYLFALNQRLSQSRCLRAGATCASAFAAFKQDVDRKKEKANRLYANGEENNAVRLLMATTEEVNQRLWKEFPPFPASAIKGAWHRPVEKTPVEIGQTLDKLKRAGLNTVFLETVFHGYTIFPSNTMTSYGLPAQNPNFAGIDALKIWLDEAHKRDMQVHPWIHTFYSGTKAVSAPGAILAKYPNWANVQYSALIAKKVDPKDLLISPHVMTHQTADPVSAVNKAPLPEPDLSNPLIPVVPAAPVVPVAQILYEAPKAPVASTLETGSYFLDPANPEVQKFVVALMREIATRYDVDGINLDYIRYPSAFPKDRYSYLKTTWGYTDIARNAFKSQFGVDPTAIDYKTQPELWMQWEAYKAKQVSDVVKAVHAMTTSLNQSIRASNPIVLSAVIFPNKQSALEQKHQDWTAWGLERDVDMLTPITLTSAVKVVSEDTRHVISSTNAQVPVAMGVFGAFNGNSAEMLLQQIDAAKEAGAGNFSIFDSAHLTGRMIQALGVAQEAKQPIISSPNDIKPIHSQRVERYPLGRNAFNTSNGHAPVPQFSKLK
ncbi:MAG: family 10 glycosylhydrolase [Vampirovibrionales bacterium]|nr:family 10 glycosylhydrolase [Vampirovibrionales bacterium]